MTYVTQLAATGAGSAPWVIGGILAAGLLAAAFVFCKRGHPGYAILLAVVIIMGQVGAGDPSSNSRVIVNVMVRLTCFAVILLGIVDMVGRARKGKRSTARGIPVVIPIGPAGTPPPLPAAAPAAVSARPRRKRTGLWLVLGLVGLAGLLVAVHLMTRESFAPSEPEDRAEVYKEAAEAFSGSAAVPEGEAAEAITKVLGRLPGGIRSGRIDDLFDWDRLRQEIFRQKGMPKLGASERLDFIRGLQKGLIQPGLADMFDRCEVRRVRLVADGREALAITRHPISGGTVMKIRWWLVRRDGDWYVYDWEFLSVGMRISRLASAGVIAMTSGVDPREFEAFMARIKRAQPALELGDGPAVIRAMAGPIPKGIPDCHMAVYWLYMAMAEMQNTNVDKAMEHLDRIDALGADMPMAMIARSRGFEMQGQYEAAERQARQYLDLLGDDEAAYGLLGDALAGQDRMSEAAEAYAASLALSPEQPDYVVSLLLALPADQKHRVAEPINALTNPSQYLDPFAEACLGARDVEALDALVQAYKPIVGDSPDRGYYAAQVRIARGQFEQAAQILREILPKVTKTEELPAYAKALMDALIGAGRPLEAYQSNPDRAGAFEYVSQAAVNRRDAEILGQLIAAYQGDAGDDVWLDYYTGEHHLMLGRYQEAHESFAAGTARGLDAETAAIFRPEHVYTLYRLRRWGDAYAVGPLEATFSQLARLFAGDEDTDGLAALVDRHGAAQPRDPNLRLWRGRLAYDRADYARVSTMLTPYRGTILADPDNELWFYDTLIRSLVETRQFDRALLEARGYQDQTGSHWYRAIIHAAAGRHAEAAKAAVDYASLGGDPELLLTEPNMSGEAADEVRRVLGLVPAAKQPHSLNEDEQADGDSASLPAREGV